MLMLKLYKLYCALLAMLNKKPNNNIAEKNIAKEAKHLNAKDFNLRIIN
jgi:hypothetical protein